MVSLLSSLNMTANALSVNEKAISVVSHNVSNMNTEGYHKQRANLVTRNNAGVIGNNVNNQIRANGGVMIANVIRYNNEYLNNYYRDQLSHQKMLEQQLDNLGNLAGVFDDLEGKGIDAALSKFYEALNNLNEYPASSTARTNFIQTAKSLTSVLNAKSIELEQMNSQALGDGVSEEALQGSKIYTQITAFNDKLQQLADVNKALQVTQTGTLEANNLLDKRDLILNDLAEFVDFTVDEKPNGSVNLYIGDAAIVKGSKVVGEFSIETAEAYEKRTGLKPNEKAVISINGEIQVDNINGILQGGTIGGLIHSGTDNQDGVANPGTVMASLNTLAQAIANIFNDLNKNPNAHPIDPNNTETLLETNPGYDIFVTGGAAGEPITAGNIQINPELLTEDGCWKIACAYFDDPNNFDVNAVGNAQNVAAMLGTRDQKLDDLKGMSIEDFYTNLVGKIASAGNNIQTQYDTQKDIVDSIWNQMNSENGVDLNEELVDLVKYQTAYAAAAQVFNTCNNCLDVLMSLGG